LGKHGKTEFGEKEKKKKNVQLPKKKTREKGSEKGGIGPEGKASGSRNLLEKRGKVALVFSKKGKVPPGRNS